MEDERARVAVDALRRAVDALLDLPITLLERDDVTELFREIERERNRLDAVDHVLIAEMEQRRIAGEYGRTSTVDLIVDQTRVAPAEARARFRAAEDLGPRRDLGGQPLPPIYEHTARALSRGELGSGAARVIIRCLDKMPPHLSFDVVQGIETTLVSQASKLPANLLARVADRALALADPDGIEPREDVNQRLRGWDLQVAGDGSGILKARLTAAACATWKVIVDALSAPHTEAPAEGEPEVHRDDRTPTQRRHDGFLEAGQRLLRSGTLPDSGGAPVTVLARVDADQLRTATGVAVTGTDDHLSVPELLNLASEAEIIPVVLNASGGVLAYGRTRRLATAGQRRALALRDGGCTFPACTRPAPWTQVHHIIAWEDGGPTDLENLCLVCAYHHREFERRGWAIVMINAMPHWIPPSWYDPERKPIRNSAHHLPDIRFDLGLAG